jgi:glycosyltransferase involved in cell wall biosynthesis
VATARKIIAGADLGIVSLTHDVYRYAYPSKTMTYLDEGCPLLVSVEADSELAQFVDREQIGLCVSPGDPDSIASAIVEAADNPQLLSTFKSNARIVADKMFSHAVMMDKWSDLVESTVTRS